MKCPRCHEFDNSVLETRKQANTVWRRRYCGLCMFTFHTCESVVEKFPTNIWRKTIERVRVFQPKRAK
jgi:transcriptional regulator NrdR family protein